MDDLIYRQDAIRAVTTRDGCGRCEKAIKNIPSAQKKGQWLLHTYMPHKNYCSCCGKDSPYDKRWKYCPNCGADMREDGESDG